jgi:hypothetical protein
MAWRQVATLARVAFACWNFNMLGTQSRVNPNNLNCINLLERKLQHFLVLLWYFTISTTLDHRVCQNPYPNLLL